MDLNTSGFKKIITFSFFQAHRNNTIGIVGIPIEFRPFRMLSDRDRILSSLEKREAGNFMNPNVFQSIGNYDSFGLQQKSGPENLDCRTKQFENYCCWYRKTVGKRSEKHRISMEFRWSRTLWLGELTQTHPAPAKLFQSTLCNHCLAGERDSRTEIHFTGRKSSQNTRRCIGKRSESGRNWSEKQCIPMDSPPKQRSAP
jgi:hypothetical protein